MRYEINRVCVLGFGSNVEYQIHDTVKNKLMSTCKFEDDAKTVCGLMNDSVTRSAEAVSQLVDEFKRSELKDAETPFHYEAEIAAGLRHFVEWLKGKSK